MNKFLKAMLAVVVVVVCSTLSRAVWDSTTGNMNNNYQLCWGLNSNACIYGSTVSNFVRIQTGGTDALTIDSSQAVGIPGALSVTGATTLTGAAAMSSTLAVTGAITATGGIVEAAAGTHVLQSYTTAQLYLRSDPIGTTFWAQERVQGAGGGALITNTYNICGSTAVNVASYVYLSVSTNTAGDTPAVVGAACAR